MRNIARNHAVPKQDPPPLPAPLLARGGEAGQGRIACPPGLAPRPERNAKRRPGLY